MSGPVLYATSSYFDYYPPTFTFQHGIAAAANKMMLVFVSGAGPDTAGADCNAVIFNGVSGTKASVTNNGVNTFITAFYFKDSQLPSVAGTYDLRIDGTNTGYAFAGTAMNFENVSQTTPQYSGTYAPVNIAEFTGSMTVNASGSMLADAVFFYFTDAHATASINNEQVQRSLTYNSQGHAASTKANVIASVQNMMWDTDRIHNWSIFLHMMFVLQPFSNASSNSLFFGAFA